MKKIPETIKLTCIHVICGNEKPEYRKEDDSYVCTKCRDLLASKGFEFVKKFLKYLHEDCLEKVLIQK